MGEYREDLKEGIEFFNDWLNQRFPEATVRFLGDPTWDRGRWIVDFGPGKAGFRVGVTPRVIESQPLLQERIHDLERGTWLENIEEKSKWVVLTAVGVVNKSREDW